MHNLHRKGELVSGNEKSARKYPIKLAKIIEEHSYSADQNFNADKTGLFWKKIPKRTYLSKSTKSALKQPKIELLYFFAVMPQAIVC